MPIDYFAEEGIDPNSAIDYLSEPNNEPMGSRPPYMRSGEQVSNLLKGFGQGVVNTGIGALNILPNVDIAPRSFAGESPEAKAGEVGGELASFFLPGGALSKIPKIAKTLQGGSGLMKALTNIGIGTGEGALFGAALEPEKSKKGQGALLGAGLGGGTSGAASLANTKNPLINTIARSLLGGGIGYGLGGTQGAEYGAAAGAVFPGAKHLLFGKPGREAIESITPDIAKEAIERYEAGKRLGRPLTPGEATLDPYVSNVESSFKRTSKGSMEDTKIGKQKYKQEDKGIDEFLNEIYDQSPESKKKIDDLYKKADEYTVTDEMLNKFKENKIIQAAFNKVKARPAFKEELKDTPENSFKHLDYVKRAMQDMEKKAGENEARIIGKTRREFVEDLDKISPEYKPAREEAQKEIIRKNIQEGLSGKKITGTAFYRKYLQNKADYKELLDSLKNVPKAQSKLKDMNLAFEGLIDLSKSTTEAYQSKTGFKQSRGWTKDIIDAFHEITGIEYNKNAIKYINSPQWIEDLKKAQSIKGDSGKKEYLSKLLGQLTTAGVLSSSKGRNE